MDKTFDPEKYLSQFTTKQQINEELERLNKNLKNINISKTHYWLKIWQKKRILLELEEHWNEFCYRRYYVDDFGRTDWKFTEK